MSIRLLAGRFADESATDLASFLKQIEAELEQAEQQTPSSLEDPERQRTLYACMDYSVKRLAPEQRKVLDAVSLFLAPFHLEFAAYVLDDEEQTPRHLQDLVRLGLLTATARTFQEGELILLELHPMLRWYIQHRLAAPDAKLQERYGEVYENLAQQSYQPQGGYDQSALMRYLVRQSLPDFEAALQYLPPAGRSNLAYHLAEPYQRLGQNRYALALYEQALEIDQELGEVRGVAVTQSAMANVLVQLGKPQEAMALYEQSLRTKQELGEVRGVAVTQHAVANVLRQLGKPQEALALYKQVLQTYQELGDLRSVTTAQNVMAGVLVHLGKPQEAMDLYEQALRTTQELGEVQGVAVTQANFSQLLLQQGEYPRALVMAWEAYISLRQSGFSRDSQIMQQLLISIKGRNLGHAQFNALWQQVISDPQPDWLRGVQSGSSGGSISINVSNETMHAVNDFVNAEDWDVTRQVVEAQQALLFQPEVEALFEQNISNARSNGDERWASILEQHLALLRGCKTIGIAQVFEQLAAAREEEEDAEEDDLPFDAELVSRSIVALLGGPQEKRAHAQYLIAQAAQTENEDLKALLDVIQLALFSNDLSQLGRDLQGVYRQAWEGIAATVEAGGVDPRLFKAIAGNTLAVLGPAANQRGEWRDNLVKLRNQATAQGDRNMVALLDAVIGLLDAGGNPAGLGGGLKGIYAVTWQQIIERLST